jgi:hypothetical protein
LIDRRSTSGHSRGDVLGCFALDALVDLFRGILRDAFRSRWNHFFILRSLR